MNGNERLKEELRKKNNERLRESMFQNEGQTKTIDGKNGINSQQPSENMTLNDVSFDDAKLDLKLDNQNLNINVKNVSNNNINQSDSSVENLSMDDVSDEKNMSDKLKKTSQNSVDTQRLGENEESNNSDSNIETKDSFDKKSEDKEKEDPEKKDEDKDKDDPEKKGEDKDKEDSEKKDEDKEKEDPEKKGDSGSSDDKETNGESSNKEENEQQVEQEKRDREKKEQKQKEDQKQKEEKDKNQNDRNQSDKNQNDKGSKDKNNSKSDSKPRQKPSDRIRDSIENKKNEVVNKLKDPKKAIKNSIKNKAVSKFNETGLGKTINTVNKAKETVRKAKIAVKTAQKFLSTIHIWGPPVGITVGVICGILLLASFAGMLFPGLGGDVNEENANYSSTDQKTLEKLEKIFDKYPNADGTLGMAIVLYPYFDNLHDGNVSSLITGDSESEEADEEEEDEELEEDEDNEDVDSDEDTKDDAEDDMYLLPFRNNKVRKRLKTVLKNISGVDEAKVKEYLKEKYFPKDSGFTSKYDKDVLTGYNGYKKMFKALEDDSKKEELEDLIISELYDIKDMFINYVYKNATCSASLVDAGNVSVDDMLKGTILVDVKVDSCKTSNISSCESWYPSPIDLGEYVKGVVWTEMSVYEGINKEKVKAQMVAAKSYVLGRYKTMGWDLKQTEDGAYVVPIRSNTNDQDYCDYNEGCINKSSGNTHGAANEAQKAILDEAWEATKNLYIYDNSKNETTGAYCASRNKTSSYDCSWCTKGNCLSQTEVEKLQDNDVYTVETILSEHYSNLAMVTIEGELASAKTVGALVCTNKNTNMTAKRNQIAANAINYASKIPYYEGGLADSKIFEENNFGTDVTPDDEGRTKKGLNGVGFVNFIYWNVLDNNFGNTNNFDNILSDSYEITYDELLSADIGYSDDKSIIGVYVGDGKWAVMDPIDGNLVIKPDDRITNYVRNNYFKNEMYNYSIRTTKPTPGEWNTTNIPYFAWPSTNSLIGECVFYVKNRGLEIIEELYRNGSLNAGQYEAYSKRLKNLSGNADQYWYKTISGNTGSVWNTFSSNAKSDSIEDIKAGAIMGVQSNSSQGAVYGHVFIIEYANSDENKIIISDSYNGNRTDCTKTDFKCITFNSYELTYEQFFTNYNSKFRGYLYFLNDN